MNTVQATVPKDILDICFAVPDNNINRAVKCANSTLRAIIPALKNIELRYYVTESTIDTILMTEISAADARKLEDALRSIYSAAVGGNEYTVKINSTLAEWGADEFEYFLARQPQRLGSQYGWLTADDLDLSAAGSAEPHHSLPADYRYPSEKLSAADYKKLFKDISAMSHDAGRPIMLNEAQAANLTPDAKSLSNAVKYLAKTWRKPK
ncbi:hypothetical protein HED60_19470 [Planctomycetales bacterium ZRK34]|nr:hypothetical protein HED60_19470 [Planctomycetales bacterium ZRK34]